MKDLETLDYHPVADKLVDILCQKTQSSNRLFFHVLVAYYFSKVSSMMRTTIKTHFQGDIPTNMYAINLALSGEGKGHSTNIIEDQVIHIFRERFLEETFPSISEASIHRLGTKRSIKKNLDQAEEIERTQKEFDLLGNMVFSFDSGTTAAVKQMRHKLLIAECGSMNMEIDEIGSNLLGNVDVLNTFLELFDVGKVKQKLVKNTTDNLRNEEIDGKTPTNMMLFGTPTKLLNGGKTEDEIMAFFETGYARRCFFGYSKTTARDSELTAQEVYDRLTDNTSDTFIQMLAQDLSDLAHPLKFQTEIQMTKDVSITLLEYRQHCEKLANSLPEHEEIRKAEITHRYFKALKLAGTYAFIDGSQDLTEDHLYNAIQLAEVSGEAFKQLLTRDRNYVKLANYIANAPFDITHVDMTEDLPFYKGSEPVKNQMMSMAIAYGYKNNIIIKRHTTDGIEFLSGESLKETNLNEMIISYGTDYAKGYRGEKVPWDSLSVVTGAPNHHWVSHHLLKGYRNEESVLAGFNMIVLDIDKDISMSTVELLLKDYKWLMYTTKRHTNQENRFRVILPMSHILRLDHIEFKEFMNNFLEWLPFKIDESTLQRSRKWMSNDKGTAKYNDGELIDSLLFIPKTKKNEERKHIVDSLQSLTNVERWFAAKTQQGNRSNQLVKYGFMLVDSGMDIASIQNNILALNAKLAEPMPENEILSTIMISVSKAILKRDTPS